MGDRRSTHSAIPSGLIYDWLLELYIIYVVGEPVGSVGICKLRVSAMLLGPAKTIGAEKGLVLPSLTRWCIAACLGG